MTPEEIMEVVKITLDELTQRRLIKVDYQIILKYMEQKIKDFFDNRGDGNGVSHALKMLMKDQYIDIIFLQYRDGFTLEKIAEQMGVEVRTITRNKKRLIIKMYEIMEEMKCE